MESKDKVSRRRFFRVVTGDFIVLFDELHGKPQLRLSELSDCPQHVLSRIKPILLPGAQAAVSKQQVTTRYEQVKTVVSVEHPDQATKFLIDRIYDGQKTIGQLTSELAANMSWDEQQSFGCARDLFLKLVKAGVCIPSNYINM